MVYKPQPTPWQVIVFPDSAFRATEPDCLAVRAGIAVVAHPDFFQRRGGQATELDFYSRKQPRVFRSTFSAELASVDDGISTALTWQVLLNEVCYGPLAAAQILWSLDSGALPIRLVAATDNRGLFQAAGAAELRAPAEPHLLYLLKALRDRLESGTVDALWWIDTRDMISDVLTKGGLSRDPILKLWYSALLPLSGDPPMLLRLHRTT